MIPRLRQGVLDALDIANLVQQLQEERAAVALNNFLLDVDDANKKANLDTIKEITDKTKTDIKAADFEKALNLSTRFMATDAALSGVSRLHKPEITITIFNITIQIGQELALEGQHPIGQLARRLF